MNKFLPLLSALIMHDVTSLLPSIVKKLKLMPFKSLTCSKLNETITYKIFEHFPKSLRLNSSLHSFKILSLESVVDGAA